MEKTKKIQKKVSKNDKASGANVECNDQFCPIHGKNKLKLRGRTFEGTVIKKLKGRLTITFERSLYVKKYERYEKRKTKLHARLADCLAEDINVGDYVQIAETRPVSKTIHFVVVKKIRSKSEEGKQ